MKSRHLALIILTIFVAFSSGKKFHCNYKVLDLPVLNKTSLVACEFSKVAVYSNSLTFEIVYKEPSKALFGKMKKNNLQDAEI